MVLVVKHYMDAGPIPLGIPGSVPVHSPVLLEDLDFSPTKTYLNYLGNLSSLLILVLAQVPENI